MGRGQTDDGRLLVIGHRGASAHAPENTHASFALAFEHGADGIEFDVRLARDGVPVVIHDATLRRTAMLDGAVESRDSTALANTYAGEWFNLRRPRRARAAYARETIPTLEQVYAHYTEGALYVEMKCEDPSRRAGLARAVAGLTRDYGLARRVVVKSFEHDSLAEVKRLAPEIRTAALFDRSLARPFVPAARILAEAEACGADEVSLHHTLARRATVGEARRRGFEALAWTVNSRLWLRRALALGLRAVFTDDPRRTRAALERLRARGPR